MKASPASPDEQGFRALLDALPAWGRAGAERASEPHRRYHAPWHLGRMWRLWRETPALRRGLEGEWADRRVALAIAWHDAAYDPRAAHPANEMLSARLMLEAGTGACPPAEMMELARIVVATADHAGAAEALRREGGRSALLALRFLDLDLEPLASPLFSRNSELLRQEFGHLDDEEWERGRRRFLGGLLQAPCLFSDAGQALGWERAARANIAASLDGEALP